MFITPSRAFAIAFSFLISFSTNSQEPLDLKVGYFVYPPHVFYSAQEDKPYGPLITFLNQYVAEPMNAKIVWQKMTNKRSERSITDCKIDLFLLKGWSEDRAKRMRFPTHPFHIAVPSLLVDKDFPVNEIRGSEDLYDLVIGWTSGLPASAIKPFWNHPRIKLVLTPQVDFYRANIGMFIRGRLTGVASSNRESLVYMAKQMDILDKVKIIPLPQESRRVFHAFSTCAEQPLNLYNQVISELLERILDNQTLAEFYLQYLNDKMND